MSSLKSSLAAYRAQSQTEREKGSYFAAWSAVEVWKKRNEDGDSVAGLLIGETSFRLAA